jgi:NDP-sugar pyrophosphorylase family protein
VCYLDESQLQPADPQLRSFFDVDTPQDLIKAHENWIGVQGLQ